MRLPIGNEERPSFKKILEEARQQSVFISNMQKQTNVFFMKSFNQTEQVTSMQTHTHEIQQQIQKIGLFNRAA